MADHSSARQVRALHHHVAAAETAALRLSFCFPLPRGTRYPGGVTVETFRHEIAEAVKAYEKYVVCVDKTPEEFQAALMSLLNKAIKAYESRGPQLRHGIALDRQVTVILSQNDAPRPLCGIYFNLHSPYQKSGAAKAGKSVREPISGGAEE